MSNWITRLFGNWKARREQAEHEQSLRDMIPILVESTVGHPSFCTCAACAMLSVMRKRLAEIEHGRSGDVAV